MNTTKSLILSAALLAAGNLQSFGQNSELEQLKAQMKTMEQTIEQMKQKIGELERTKSATAGATSTNPLEMNSPSIQTVEKEAAGQSVGEKSPITYRGALNDQQEAASRPKDFTL